MSDNVFPAVAHDEAKDYIRQWRNALGLSISKLAAMSGMDHASISRYERGKFIIDLVNLSRISNAMGLPYQALLRPPPLNLDEALAAMPEEKRSLIIQIIAEMINPPRVNTTRISD